MAKSELAIKTENFRLVVDAARKHQLTQPGGDNLTSGLFLACAYCLARTKGGLRSAEVTEATKIGTHIGISSEKHGKLTWNETLQSE